MSASGPASGPAIPSGLKDIVESFQLRALFDRATARFSLAVCGIDDATIACILEANAQRWGLVAAAAASAWPFVAEERTRIISEILAGLRTPSREDVEALAKHILGEAKAGRLPYAIGSDVSLPSLELALGGVMTCLAGLALIEPAGEPKPDAPKVNGHPRFHVN